MTRDTSKSHPNRFYMADLERELDRKRATIRGWERDELLPQWLMPKRDEYGWRYWTKKQVDGLKSWMKRNDMRPGRGIAQPKSEADVKAHLEKLRQPRKPSAATAT